VTTPPSADRSRGGTPSAASSPADSPRPDETAEATSPDDTVPLPPAGAASPAPTTGTTPPGTDPLAPYAAAATSAAGTTADGAEPAASGGALRRARSTVRRHPLVTGAVAVVLATGIGFGGGYAVGHAADSDQPGRGGFPGGQWEDGDMPQLPDGQLPPDGQQGGRPGDGGQGGSDDGTDSDSGSGSASDSGSASGSGTAQDGADT
jgi:hypothetical protein